MPTQIPQHAGAVVIGGGVIGCSVAYHLAKLGWSDVVLLERRRFACGTTWHAAGLVGTMRANESQARLCEYSMSVLKDLEAETGQSTGFKQVGSLSIAHSAARFEELKRVAAMNNAFGVTQVDIITAAEIKNRCPLLETGDLLGGSWVPHDGYASPVDVTAAFVKGARAHGALCIEGAAVTAVTQAGGKVTGVVAEQDGARIEIKTDYVVNCGGMWARGIGRMAGVNVPLHACEHYYAVTEKLADLPADLPVMRDHDRCAYYKPEAGGLLVGAFEPDARPWGQDGIPADFCFDEIDGHFDEQLMPVLEDAMQRVPLLQTVGWRKFFCGPESFTPDDQFHIGEAPELKRFYIAAGLNSVGIQTSGGLGRALADWMHHGHPPMDLSGNDIRRMHPFQGTRRYLRARVSETLGLLYDNHFPFRQFATARDVRHSPLHERLASHGACFGEAAGWERPNWFAPAAAGVAPKYEYSFGKQNWFEYSAAEHRAFREGVALFDQSSFAKYLVQGRDSCRILQRICSADVDVAPGRMVYTHWLNARGGIEADLTVTRIAEDEFFVVSAAASSGRDMDWLRRHIDGDGDSHCIVNDVTCAWAVLGVMGPASRGLLTDALDCDLSTAAFPFGQVREVEINCAVGRAARVSFVGELGWEVYVPADMARHAFDHLWRAGEGHGLRLAGLHALDSGRIEKKFLHFGHDVADEDTPLESGCAFVCAWDKPIPFTGRDALLKQKENGAWKRKRLVQFLLQDPGAILYHHEPILRDGQIVGHLTSGNYGHTLGASVGLGYVHHDGGVDQNFLDNAVIEIDVGGERVPVKASLTALYDPKGTRMRG